MLKTIQTLEKSSPESPLEKAKSYQNPTFELSFQKQ